jgi:hypothetical protein
VTQALNRVSNAVMRNVLRIALLGALAWGGPASDGDACDCGSAGGLCGAAGPGATVFIGRALSAGVDARFEVERSLKGTARGVVTIANSPGPAGPDGRLATDCTMRLEVGERYLVFAYRETSTGVLDMNPCSRTRPLRDAVARADLAFLEERLRSDSPKGLLTGSLIDATRHRAGPIRLDGVRVTVRPDGRRPMHTLSDPQGRFRFTGIPAGRLTITADFPDTFKPHVPFPVVMPAEWPSCVETAVHGVAQVGR